jgi:hypothetical protein
VRILGIDPDRSEGERMVEYPPMQIKLAVTGHGHADKDDVLDAAAVEAHEDKVLELGVDGDGLILLGRAAHVDAVLRLALGDDAWVKHDW